MSRIQSSVGLISGIPIEDTVNQLMAVAARPKNLITSRNQVLTAEKLAFTQLSSLLVAFQFESNQLGTESLYSAKQVTSSKAAALTATVSTGGTPAVGSYLVTPVRTATGQQLLSQTFGTDQTVGAGAITFQKGGFVDRGVSLDEINGGAGLTRGKIRITDRSGASAVVDLNFARTVDDVLQAISSNTTINVTASAIGDTFRLTDNTGGSGNLVVAEVAGGSTAASLGLAGINVVAATATGGDVLALSSLTRLSSLNDGIGVQQRSGNDLSIALADESTVSIDLDGAATVGDVLDAINAASPAKVSAAISADGNRIELTDLTAGAGTFAVSNVGSGTAADDLGLSLDADGDTLTGRRLLSGLRDTLAVSLHGGQGLGTLGDVDFTNRDNVSFTVDLSGAETLGEIVAAINDQATGVTAAINAARNGIELTDTTGGSASNLTIADGDANDSATALGIVTDAAVTKVNGGTLNRRTVSEATLLSSLNGGAGIKVGDFIVTDSAGNTAAVDLNPINNHAQTLGDVIDRINALSNVQVEARINDSGDGIVLVDTASGNGKLKVIEVGNGTTAKDLRILGESKTVDIDDVPTQVIDGTARSTVVIEADDKLADVAAAINALNAGVTATVLNDTSGQRLSITSSTAGAANELLFDSSQSNLVLQEIVGAQDALVQYGGAGSGGGLLVSSITNTFTNVIDGITLTVKEGQTDAVTITVAATSSGLTSAVQEFVDAYNSIREALDTVTAFDPEELTTGILFGRNEALRVDTELSRTVGQRYFGVGTFTSLEAIGISLNDKGQLELDAQRLTAAYNEDPAALKSLFTDKTRGVAAELNSVVEQLAGVENSTLSSRIDALTRIIDTNTARITRMDETLARQRERMLSEFFRIESVIAKLQEDLSALSSLQVLPSLINQSAN